MTKINKEIIDLLDGADARTVVEDISRTAAHYAASLVHYEKMSKSKAIKTAREEFGVVPNLDLMHTMTKGLTGKPKKEPEGSHWVKFGFFR